MRSFFVLIVGVPLVGVLALSGARHFGGELVTLYTVDDYGRHFDNPLWVVDSGNDIWIRAVRGDTPWLQRVDAHPEVQLKRGGVLQSYRAKPLRHRRDRINAAMAQRYGWAEWLLAMVEDRAEAVPVYLDPFGEG